jgi:demethylmenaquinone methyltransferase/2-methoxy-6-polyprenyl-1,4-benzoquinol methylase
MSSPPTTPEATWDQNLLRDPHAVADKRDRVRKMFAAIAPSYDLNNRLHSLWQDQRWRRKAVKLANLKATDVVVDVACGTGDLTLKFALAKPQAAIGVDFTFEMLPIARSKLQFANCKSQIQFVHADAQALPFPDHSTDVVSIAFGIRNVQDPMAALHEFHRILRRGGRVIILEFSLPMNRVLRALYNCYFRKVLPRTATWISRDKTGAYKYLPESVNTFITRDRMVQMMREAGFENVEQFPMTFGVCVCYRAFTA